MATKLTIRQHLIRNSPFSAYVQKRLKTEFKRIKEKTWKGVVGLEIHAQILSSSKLFSGAGTDFGSPVNSSVSFFDAAIPGTLPVLNRRCVEAGVLTALALSCQINPVSSFDRKHYFYADLPAGYQITQQRSPLAHNGQLEFQVFTPGIHKKPYTKTSRIHQLQLEQDSGKSLHDEEARRSLVDLNRAGIPLMELVFEPDLQDGEEAAALIRELTNILKRIGTCSCRMEEGALRVDANVSVHREGEPLGVRTEVKNIGSIRGVANAIRYEISRQTEVLESGGTVVNETRAWDALNKQTVPMRDKEEKQDYRYMPEPNLPPLRLLMDGHPTSQPGLVNVQELQNKISELPGQTRQRLQSKFGISAESAIILVNEDVLFGHFTSIMEGKKGRDSRLTVNLLIMELLTLLNKRKMTPEECSVSSEVLGEIVDLQQSRRINLLTAKKLLQEVVSGSSLSPTQIVEEQGWTQITDPAEIHKICKRVLQENAKLVHEYRAGKKKLFGAFVGLVAKQTEGQADMAAVAQQLKAMLDENKNS